MVFILLYFVTGLISAMILDGLGDGERQGFIFLWTMFWAVFTVAFGLEAFCKWLDSGEKKV